MPIKRTISVAVALCVSAFATSLQANILDQLVPSEGWQTASAISLSEDRASFVAETSGDASIVFNNGGLESPSFLLHKQWLGDAVVSLEFMVPENSDAALFLVGRYELKLAATSPDSEPSTSIIGALAGGKNRDQNNAPFPAIAPLANASKGPGEWQTLEVRFRPLRYDDAHNKTDPSFLLSATLNGVLIQQNQSIPYYTPGSIQEWEGDSGQYGIRGANGPIAIRKFTVSPADYNTVVVPHSDNPTTNLDELIDHVALGQKTFKELGCIECHTTKKSDPSMKTGPNLYGLFTRNARKREVQEQATNNHYLVEADFNYFQHSVRASSSELAISESGPKQGEAYLPVMPPYSDEILPDAKVAAIFSYLKTLNDPAEIGPVEVLVEKDGPKIYKPLEDTMLLLVDGRTRIQRGSMAGVSGRSIHVAQSNGINFTFDPRTLGIEKLWQGGFIDGSGEWKNRGGDGFAPGFDNKEISLGTAGSLIAPLLPDGSPVDFSFKDALFRDWDTIDASLNNEKDHLDLVSAVDAQFLGYGIDSTDTDDVPTFRYRVGENELALRLYIDTDDTATIEVSGNLPDAQSFSFNTEALADPSSSSGDVDASGTWTVPAGKTIHATLSGKLQVAANIWRPEPSDFDHLRQPLVVEPTDADTHVPAGYRSERFLPPLDNYGRPLLFEACGIDVAPDGTIVVATRTSGIWRLVGDQWRLFAEGTFDSLGVVVEDEHGLQVVIGQKPELTRIADTNGDELADTFDTLSDQFSYHSNYHSYMHGPARDADGNYYYNLNLLHADNAIYKAKGLYMGTSGGFSGWCIKITPDGKFIPYASGLRSPAGLAFGPDGRLWYTENQGEYVGTSKLFAIEEGKFYGHPGGLIDLPGMSPDSPEIQWPAVAENKERAIVLFPHNFVANSPGNPGWDTTDGKFGPFAGQMFVGDQTQSKLYRVVTETVDGHEQGAVIPFAQNLLSGIMRPVFLPDGSLIIGQTGRGWQAKGGKVASLQRLVWDGETVAPDLLTVAQAKDAFTLVFTQPISKSVSNKQLQAALSVKSWAYRDAPDYGSPELDQITESIAGVSLSADRKSLTLTLKPSEKKTVPHQTARVYHIEFDTEKSFDASAPKTLETWTTTY